MPILQALPFHVEGIRQRFGSGVGLAFVHFPLPMHRFGEIAARAAECAEQQGRFAAFIDVTYRKQDSLGLKNWASYGQDAGVPDSARFRRCVESAAPVARIDSGLAVGKRIGVEGTPTVIVGGWRFFAPPSSEELARVVRALLTGEAPFPVTASRAN
jgi:protein-disulfide isomerase